MSLLTVNGLRTRFKTPAGWVTAVDDVSFSLEKGRILGIVGESGSGKSVTAMSLMNLLDPPAVVEAKDLRFLGESLQQATPKQWNAIRGKRMAMVFQDPMMSLNPVMRVGAQLIETVLVHGGAGKQEAHARAVEALRSVGIPAAEERMHAYPHELSGGMRQRVAIANAIINKPELVIADEPTTALDVTIQAQILFEARRLSRESGTAMIWITHDLAVVKDLADDLCVMYAGRVVEHGPVAEIIRKPRHPYTRGLLESLPSGRATGRRLRPIPGATPPLHSLPTGCTFAPRCAAAGAQCSSVPPITTEGRRSFRCFHPV